jgi:hypothetical protein
MENPNMKLFWFGLFGSFLIAPTLPASPIGIFTTNASATFSFGATTTYEVVADSQGITSQAFTSPATSTDPATLTLILDYGSLAGDVINNATLDLSSVLTAGALSSTQTLSHSLNGGHTVGNDPTFSSSSAGVFVSIAGPIGGTQTLNLASTTNYNLMPFFLNDLEAGNPLTVHISLSDVFSTTSLASNGDTSWKSETATYALSQTTGGTFSASTNVSYTAPVSGAPEPTTLLITGAGLALVGITGRKIKKPTARS